MLILLAIFAAGLLHGLGPDHLAAITAFAVAVEHDFRRVVLFATRFAGGHAVVIVIAGLLGHFGRMLLNPGWERRFDLAAGALLVFTGLVAIVGLLTGKLKVHQHHHLHHKKPHKHYHLHVQPQETPQEHAHAEHGHVHGGLAASLGILFALGGTRSLLAVVPMAVSSTLTITLLRIAAFVLGIVLSMVGYAFLTQRAFEKLSSRASAAGRAPAFLLVSSYLLAVFCIIAGLMTIHERMLA